MEGEEDVKGAWGKGGGKGRERDSRVENKCDFSCRRKEAMSFARAKLVWQPVPEGVYNERPCSLEAERPVTKRPKVKRTDCGPFLLN